MLSALCFVCECVCVRDEFIMYAVLLLYAAYANFHVSVFLFPSSWVCLTCVCTCVLCTILIGLCWAKNGCCYSHSRSRTEKKLFFNIQKLPEHEYVLCMKYLILFKWNDGKRRRRRLERRRRKQKERKKCAELMDVGTYTHLFSGDYRKLLLNVSWGNLVVDSWYFAISDTLSTYKSTHIHICTRSRTYLHIRSHRQNVIKINVYVDVFTNNVINFFINFWSANNFVFK